MVSEAELSKLILLVYEAATEPSLWPKFMKGYTEALDADLAAIQVHHFDAGRSEVLAQFGMNPRFSSSYNEHYSKMKLWRNYARSVHQTVLRLLEEEL